MTDTPQGAQNPAYRLAVTQTEHTARYAPLLLYINEEGEEIKFNEEGLTCKV